MHKGLHAFLAPFSKESCRAFTEVEMCINEACDSNDWCNFMSPQEQSGHRDVACYDVPAQACCTKVDFIGNGLHPH